MTITLAQITDTHLLADRDAELRGVKTWHSLKHILQTVAQHQPELIILTGDLAHTGEAEAYEHLSELLGSLGEIPCYWLPGNHDCPTLLSGVFQGDNISPQKTVTQGNWRFILLDSYFEQAVYGEGQLSEAQFDFLAQELAQAHEQSVAIALHHHPVTVGIDWLDQMGLLNGERFLDLITTYPQVKAVFFGHIHSEFHQTIQGIHFWGTPSTCTQVTPAHHQEHPDVVQPWQQPGFRLFHLHDNGDIHTEVQRLAWF